MESKAGFFFVAHLSIYPLFIWVLLGQNIVVNYDSMSSLVLWFLLLFPGTEKTWHILG